MTASFDLWKRDLLRREQDINGRPATAPKYFGEPSSRHMLRTLIAEMQAEGRLRRAAEAAVNSEEYRHIGPHAKPRPWLNVALGLTISALPGLIAWAVIRYFDHFGGFTQDGR